MRRLNVCRGGFTYEAAGSILELYDDLDTLDDLLATLQEWQFVVMGREESGERYDTAPLVLEAVGEDEEAYIAHYYYYLELARSHDEVQDYLGLDIETTNLDTMFERCLRLGNSNGALILINACANFLNNRGRFRQRTDWAQRVIVTLDEASEFAYANAQNSLGNAYSDLSALEDREGNLRHAIKAFQAALKYSTPDGAPLYYAATQDNLGNAYRLLSEVEDQKGNLLRSIKAYEAVLAYWTPEHAPLDYAMAQRNLGLALESNGELARAVQCWREAETYYRRMGPVDEADRMLQWIADAKAEANFKGEALRRYLAYSPRFPNAKVKPLVTNTENSDNYCCEIHCYTHCIN